MSKNEYQTKCVRCGLVVNFFDLKCGCHKADTVFESYEKGKKSVLSKGRTENADGSFNIEMRCSIDGLIYQIEHAKRLTEIRHTKFPLREFVQNFDKAKAAFVAGDLESVGQFFMLYVGEK